MNPTSRNAFSPSTVPLPGDCWRLKPALRALAAGLFVGLASLAWTPASAQELLKNGNFEAPFPGTNPNTNWTVVYFECGPADLGIAGQTTEASRSGPGRGAHLRAATPSPAHAWFSQIVTNLTPGSNYTFTIQKMMAGFQNYVDSGKLSVYAALVSGSTSNVVFGDGTIVGPYTLNITAETTQIDVQLHMKKLDQADDLANDFKSSKCSGWFDDASLVRNP